MAKSTATTATTINSAFFLRLSSLTSPPRKKQRRKRTVAMYSDFGNFDPPPHAFNDQMPISMVDSCNSNDCLVEQCKV
ncbi:hypothetical protein HPP92_014427 [Vanilla planifolia]|uniref:Uncharacterized protein n=1 Tax=Vanilla planifolia TaxID=51239 RepID=A0A835QJZ9_VANPL|nr:hypothetical protein HPP92_014838 [Vanilla planifolia]KAG0474741.1 hypothetical protein HPP92_014427 [Vanilla planifolia]